MESWGRWNWTFHSALYEPANRPKTLALVKNLNVNCDRHTRLHLVVTRDLWKHITDAGQYLKEFITGHRAQHS